jgi:hypothetical protein
MENLHVPHAGQAASPENGPAKLTIAADRARESRQARSPQSDSGLFS